METKAYKTVFHISYSDETNEYQEEKVIYIKTTEAEKKSREMEKNSRAEKIFRRKSRHRRQMWAQVWEAEKFITAIRLQQAAVQPIRLFRE